MQSEGRQVRMWPEVGASRSRSSATGMLSLIMGVCGVLSCEHSVTIKGTITIPVAVQQRFSSADRGRVVISAEGRIAGRTGDGRMQDRDDNSVQVAGEVAPQEKRTSDGKHCPSCWRDIGVWPLVGPGSLTGSIARTANVVSATRRRPVCSSCWPWRWLASGTGRLGSLDGYSHRGPIPGTCSSLAS